MADDDTSTKTPRNDVDDISLGSTKPVKQGGSGGVTVLLLLVVIAVVAVLAYMGYQKKQEEAKARAQAETTRQVQLDAARKYVQEAIKQAADGNITAATAKLQAAENQLGIIIAEANTEDNQQAAAEALAQRQVVIEARKIIEAENLKFQTAVQTQMDALRAKFGAPAEGTTPAQAPSSPAASTPGAETAPTAAPTTAPDAAAPASPTSATPTAPAAPATTTAPAPPAAVPVPTPPAPAPAPAR